MLAAEVYEFRNYLKDRGIMFCYSGYMTEDILTGIGDAIKKKLALDDADSKTARSVFAVFVEQMQNVIRYSVEKEPPGAPAGASELSFGVLTVGKDGDDFFVTCGNKVASSDVARLEKSLTEIKGLDKLGLKTLYKQTLKGEVPEFSVGAGVGFIDIARKATRGIEFDFMDIDGDFSFFSLKAYI